MYPHYKEFSDAMRSRGLEYLIDDVRVRPETMAEGQRGLWSLIERVTPHSLLWRALRKLADLAGAGCLHEVIRT
jgi:hypothetical protein